MALVDYGSSDSEQEPSKPAGPPKEKAPRPSKPAFEKLVDKTKPGLIRVSLAEDPAKGDQEDVPEPPAKRAKTSTFGDFNSFLPAPKRPVSAPRGLAKGVNLKTGAAPGFTREPVTRAPDYDHSQEDSNGLDLDEEKVTTTAPLSEKTSAVSDNATENPTDEQPKKKATMFKPLSVARKPAKKKPIPTANQSTTSTTTTSQTPHQDSAPKVSLFSIGDVSDNPNPPITPSNTYQPLIYSTHTPHEPKPHTETTWEQTEAQETPKPQPTPPHSNQTESLDDIATDLNLSASARRQLLGRTQHQHQRNNNNHNKTNNKSAPSSSIKITTFNTDEEYASNEALRQSGEIVQHNAVRGVAPGKHSLKQLVNAATSQKDALEEQFAAGRRNKSEAGARYGW